MNWEKRRGNSVWGSLRLSYLLGIIILVLGLFLFFFPFSQKELPVEFVVYCQGVRPSVAEHVKEGDVVLSDAGGFPIGEVVQVKVRPARRVVATDDGRLVLTEDPFFKDMWVKIKSRAYIRKDVVSLRTQVIQVGMDFVLMSGRYRISGRVVDLNVQ